MGSDHDDYSQNPLDEDLDSTYQTNQDQHKEELLAFLGSIGLITLVQVLKTQKPETLKLISDLPSSTVNDARTVAFIQQLFPNADHAAANITAKEGGKYLAQLDAITNKLQGLHDVEWPGYIENLEYQNMTTITNKLGMFGAVESTKQGTINTYKESAFNFIGNVRIPWVCADNRACSTCLKIGAAGPYPPDQYPAPPHGGCRCRPGNPVLVYDTNMFSAFRTMKKVKT